MAQEKDPIVLKMREDFDNALKSNPSDDLKRLAEKIKPHLEWIERKSLEVRYEPRPSYDRYNKSRDIVNDMVSAVTQIADAEIVGIDVQICRKSIDEYCDQLQNLSIYREAVVDERWQKRSEITAITNQIKEKVTEKKTIEFEKQAKAFLKLAQVCYALFPVEKVNIALVGESWKNLYAGYDDFKSKLILKADRFESTCGSDEVFQDREKVAVKLLANLSEFIKSHSVILEVLEWMENINKIIEWYPKEKYNQYITPVFFKKLKNVSSKCSGLKTALDKISAATLAQIGEGKLKEEIKLVLEMNVKELRQDAEEFIHGNSSWAYDNACINTLDRDDENDKPKYQETKNKVEEALNKIKIKTKELSANDPEFKEFDNEADKFLDEYIQISKNEEHVLYVALNKILTDFMESKLQNLWTKIHQKISANELKIKRDELKIKRDTEINNFSEKSFEPLFESPSEETIKALSELKKKYQYLLERLKTDEDKSTRDVKVSEVLEQITDISRKDKNILFVQQFNAAKKIWESVFELIPKHRRKESIDKNYSDFNHDWHRVKCWQNCVTPDELKERYSNIKACVEEALVELMLPDKLADYLYERQNNDASFKENIQIMEFLAEQEQAELKNYLLPTELDEIRKLYQPYAELKNVVKKIESLDFSSGVNDSLSTLDTDLKEFKTKIKSIKKDNIWGSGISAVGGKYKQKYNNYLAALKDKGQGFDELYVSLDTKIKTIEARISTILVSMPDLKSYQETLEGVKTYIVALNQNKSQNYSNNFKMLQSQNEAVEKLGSEVEELVKKNIVSRAEKINKNLAKMKEGESGPELILIFQKIKLLNQWLQPASLISGIFSAANALTKDEKSKKLIQLEQVEIPKDEKTIKLIFDSLKAIEDGLDKFEIEAEKNKYTLLLKKLKDISEQKPLPVKESSQVDESITGFKSKVLEAIKIQLEKNPTDTADLNEWRKYNNIAQDLASLFETAELFENGYEEHRQKIFKLSLLEKYFDNEFKLTDDFKQIRSVSVANVFGKTNFLTVLDDWCEDRLHNDCCVLNNSKTFESQKKAMWTFNAVQGKGGIDLDQAYKEALLISRTKLSGFLIDWQNFTTQIKNNADFSAKLLALKQKFSENFFELKAEDLRHEELFKPYRELTPELMKEFNKLKEDYDDLKNQSDAIEAATKKLNREKSKNEAQLLEQKALREKIQLVNKLVTDIKDAKILDEKKISELDDVRREINALLGQDEGVKLPKFTQSELKIILCHDEKLYAISGADKAELVNQKLINYQAELEAIIQTEKNALMKTILEVSDKLSKFPNQDNPVRSNVVTEINKHIQKIESRLKELTLSEILKAKSECRSALALMKFVELWETTNEKISREFYQADVVFEFLAEEYEKPGLGSLYYSLKNKLKASGAFYQALNNAIDFSIRVEEHLDNISSCEAPMEVSNKKTMKKDLKVSDVFGVLKISVSQTLELFNNNWKKIDGEKYKIELEALKLKIPQQYQKYFLMEVTKDIQESDLFDSYRAMLAIKDEFDKFQSNISEKQKEIETQNQSDQIKSDQASLREIIKKINEAVSKILIDEIVVESKALDQCDDSRRKLNDMLGQSEGVKLLSASKLVSIANCLESVPYPIDLKKYTLPSIVSHANIYLGQLQTVIQQHEVLQAKTESEKQEALKLAKENYQTMLKNKEDALLKIKDKPQFTGFLLGKEFALDNKSTAEIITETQSLKETINHFNQAFSQYELLEHFSLSDIVLKNMQDLTANIKIRRNDLISDKNANLDNLGKLKEAYEKARSELNNCKSQMDLLESRYLPLDNIAPPDFELLKNIEEKLKAIGLSQKYFSDLQNECPENWGATVFQAEKKKVEDINKQYPEAAKQLPVIKKSITDYLEQYKQKENQVKENEKQEAARKTRETLMTQLNSAKSNYETEYKKLENLKQQCETYQELKGVNLGNNKPIVNLEITDKTPNEEIVQKTQSYRAEQATLSKLYEQQKKLMDYYLHLADAQNKLEQETGKKLEQIFGVGQSLEEVVKKKQEIFYKAIADIQQKLKTANTNAAEQAKKLGEYVRQLKEKFESGPIADKKNINDRDALVTSANNTRNMIQAWEKNLVNIATPVANLQKLTEQLPPNNFIGLGDVLSLIGEKVSEKLPENTLSANDIQVEAEKSEFLVSENEYKTAAKKLEENITAQRKKFNPKFTLGGGLTPKSEIESKIKDSELPKSSKLFQEEKSKVLVKTVELNTQITQYEKLEKIEGLLLPGEETTANQEKQSKEISSLTELKTAVSAKKSQVKEQIQKINGQVKEIKKECAIQEEEFNKVKKAQGDFQKRENARQEQRRKNNKPVYLDKSDSGAPKLPDISPLEKNIAEVKKKIGEWETKFSALSQADPLEWKEEALQEAAKSKSEMEAKLEAEKNKPEQKLSVQINQASTKVQDYKTRIGYWQLKEETEDKIQEYEAVLDKVQGREENYNSYYQDEIAGTKKLVKNLQEFQAVSCENSSVEELKQRQKSFKQAIENFEKSELVTIKAVDEAQKTYLKDNDKKLPPLPKEKTQHKNIPQKAYAEKMKKLAAEKKAQQLAVSDSVKKTDKAKEVKVEVREEKVQEKQDVQQKQKENRVEKTEKKDEPKNGVKKENHKKKKAKEKKKHKEARATNAQLNQLIQPAVPVPLVINQPVIFASPQVIAQPSKPAEPKATESKVDSKPVKEYLQKNFVPLTFLPPTETINSYTEAFKQVERRQEEFRQKVIKSDSGIPNDELSVYRDFYLSKAESILPRLKSQHWLADFLQNSPKVRGFFGIFSDDFSDPNWINQNCSYEFKTGKEKEQLANELKDLEGRVPRLVQYFETIILLEKSKSILSKSGFDVVSKFNTKATEILNQSTKSTQYDYQQAFEELRVKVCEKVTGANSNLSAQSRAAKPKNHIVANSANANSDANALSRHGKFAASQQVVKPLIQAKVISQLELLKHNYEQFMDFYENNSRAWVLARDNKNISTQCYEKINKNLTAINKMLDKISQTKNASGQDFNQIFFEIVFARDEVNRMEMRLKSKERFPNPVDTKSISDWMQVFQSDLVGQNQYSVCSMMNKHMTGVKIPTWSDSVSPRKNNAM